MEYTRYDLLLCVPIFYNGAGIHENPSNLQNEEVARRAAWSAGDRQLVLYCDSKALLTVFRITESYRYELN